MNAVQGPHFVSRRYLALATAMLLVALVGALALATTVSADATVTITEGSQSDINSWGFTPPEVTIPAGQAITWTNGGSIAHTATATGGQFDTGMIAPGESKTVTLSAPGTYAYQCTPHPWMKGTITVTAAANAPAAAPAPAAPAAAPAAAPPAAAPAAAPPAAPAAQAQMPTPTPLRLATPTPFRFVPSTTTGATTTTTTTAPQAGGFPVEMAAPLLAAGASALGGGLYVLRRGRRRE